MIPKQEIEGLRKDYLEQIKNSPPSAVYNISPPSNELLNQIPVYQQKHENLCGYHTLNNLISFDLNNPELLLCEIKYPSFYQVL